MRLVNSHQPSSELNPYLWKYRHDVCTGIFRRAEHKFSFPVGVVITGDLNVDKHQIANFANKCDLASASSLCAANRRKALNGEKPMNEPNSTPKTMTTNGNIIAI